MIVYCIMSQLKKDSPLKLWFFISIKYAHGGNDKLVPNGDWRCVCMYYWLPLCLVYVVSSALQPVLFWPGWPGSLQARPRTTFGRAGTSPRLLYHNAGSVKQRRMLQHSAHSKQQLHHFYVVPECRNGVPVLLGMVHQFNRKQAENLLWLVTDIFLSSNL